MSGFDIAYPSANAGRNAADLKQGEFSDAVDPTDALSKQKRTRAEADAKLLSTLNTWWIEARDAHAPNRAQQHKDADFYDHHQIDEETAAAMIERGQAPLVYNLVKPAVDWVIGTERRTRVDWKVHPRGAEDAPAAQAKQHAMKYVDDVNDGSFARSHAFSHAVKVGIGWLEECINEAGDEEPITNRHEDWKNMWWDPFARDILLRDSRYMTRAKFMDVDYAIAMFPDAADAIERSARAADELDLDDYDDPADVPGLYFNRTSHDHALSLRDSSPFSAARRLRSRVRVLETWYRKPKKVRRMSSLEPDLHRKVFDVNNAEHARALNSGLASLHDGLDEDLCVALWMPGTLLVNKPSPYKHKRYPFTPIIAYRDDKNGMPYGLIRGMRDAQDDYNKRRAKALFLLSVDRLIYEEGVIDEADEQDFLDEASAPNAQLRVANGALANNRIKFENGRDLAAAQTALMEQDRLHIYEGNGITRENLGQESNAISGRAILAKQQQGAVTTAELFDNYRLAFRHSGKKTLSLVEQFMTMPKRIRIVGAKGAADWIMLNEPIFDPATGEVLFNNDMAAREADFYVDQQDYRETIRMAMAESLFEVIKGLPPELQINLLDLAIDLTDLPNRAEFVQRIRALNGQAAPGEEQSPEAMAKRQAQADAQAQAQQLDQEERKARIRKDHAAATKSEADARKSTVETRAAALNTAHVLAASLPLAPAADRLAEMPPPPTAAQETP